MPLADDNMPTCPRAERLIREATGQAHVYCARNNISGEAALHHLIGRLESVIRVLGSELQSKAEGVAP